MARDREPHVQSSERSKAPESAPAGAPVASPDKSEGVQIDVEGALRPTVLPRTLDARELLGDGRVLHIEHAGEIYTLRLTRNDRLILTK